MKRHTLTILTSFLLLTGSASFAFANGSDCQVDDDCTGNRICVEYESGGCTVSPCEAGQECPEPECDSTSYKSCQLPPPDSCNQDADCSLGLLCVTRTTTSCHGGGSSMPPCTTENDTGCSANTEPSETTEECTTSTEGYCLPPYLAPCTDDASCGSPGFTCEAAASDCSCASPAPGIPGSDGNDGNETSCDCPEPDEGDRYCELENISCTTDAECDNDFICHQLYGPAPDSTCSYDSSTGVEKCDDPAEGNNYPNVGRCAPADYPYWMSGGHGSNSQNSGATKDESNTSGEFNTGNNASGSSNAPGQNNNANDDHDANQAAGDDPDGCHIASLNTGKTSTTALLLAGAAALFSIRRRRKH